MSPYKKLILEVKRFPESQLVMDDPEWFPIFDMGNELIIGDSAYAKVIDVDELVISRIKNILESQIGGTTAEEIIDEMDS